MSEDIIHRQRRLQPKEIFYGVQEGVKTLAVKPNNTNETIKQNSSISTTFSSYFLF